MLHRQAAAAVGEVKLGRTNDSLASVPIGSYPSPYRAGQGGGLIGRISDGFAAILARRLALLIGLLLAAWPARAAVLDEHDTSRLAAINEAIQSFEDDIVSALHSVSRDDLEQLESYSYVKLNLEAAHERLNTIFMQVAVSIYMDSPADQSLILTVIYSQLLLPSKNYLNEKKDAIASMALAHPESKVIAAYSARAKAILGERAVPLLDELYQRIGSLQR
jgi:hypothetical protein